MGLRRHRLERGKGRQKRLRARSGAVAAARRPGQGNSRARGREIFPHREYRRQIRRRDAGALVAPGFRRAPLLSSGDPRAGHLLPSRRIPRPGDGHRPDGGRIRRILAAVEPSRGAGRANRRGGVRRVAPCRGTGRRGDGQSTPSPRGHHGAAFRAALRPRYRRGNSRRAAAQSGLPGPEETAAIAARRRK